MERKKVLEFQRGIHEDIGRYIQLIDTKTGEAYRKFTPYEPLELE